MDFYKRSLRDFKGLKKNAILRASGGGTEDSDSMTKGDWAGIGLQLLGAVSQQKTQDDEAKRLQLENDQKKQVDARQYRDERGDVEDQKIGQAQDRRFRGLNFMNDQVDSSRETARKRTFRDAMYDTMRA